MTDFPNGGGGFTGPLERRSADDQHAAGAAAVEGGGRRRVLPLHGRRLRAPLPARARPRRGKPGRAWASIRESEPAALAAGVNITLYKLWAFALASFVTGVAGCLLAAQVGVPRAITFQTQDSLTLAATALIGGIFSLWGAVVAGIFNQLLPFLFQAQWGVNPNFLLILFGAGLLQVLLTAPGGLADQFPKDMANLGRLDRARRAQACRATGAGVVIEVDGLTVRFAGVTPIDGMSRRLPGGTCGLIGPNGAGKTTFFNVLSGFVKPAAGTVTRLRREPAEDGRLPAGALGAAADVPDRDGDREALGLRQRRDDPRALGREACDAPRRRARARSSSSG